MKPELAIIGGGPAGLMAAEMLAAHGARVTVYEAKPSLGRKFLMAGKSGLNLTKDEGLEAMSPHYAAAEARLKPMLAQFGAAEVQDWARGLGQAVFTGSSGRVFPVAMKGSPLLRAWLSRLGALGVVTQTRWRWTGWGEGGQLCFDTPNGPQIVQADAVILALGGASWARLGSDGLWRARLEEAGVTTVPFGPSNVGLLVDWSVPMQRHFGVPLKGVAWHCAGQVSRGEGVVTKAGLEGGGLYPLSPSIRGGAPLTLDLLPEIDAAEIQIRLARRGKASLSTALRKLLSLSAVKIALLQEWQRPLPAEAAKLAALIKALPVAHSGPQPLDLAISTSGGVAWESLDEGLMLRARPGVFCAGEMVDWEAPTGGYLLTACLATGRWAGLSAARYVGLIS